MLVLFGRLVALLTAILGWGSFLVAAVLAVALFLEGKHKSIAAICICYAIAFLIVRFVFPQFYFQWMPTIALVLTILGTVRSTYEDKVNRKRWWNH